jgi:aspartate aminotransferase
VLNPAILQAVTAKADRRRGEGKRVINLGVGEPDFDTPEHIKQAAAGAMWAGMTKYTAVGGTAGLKQAIVDKFRRDNQLDYEPAQIIVSCGAKHSIFNLMQAALDPGDEVIIPAPYWPSFVDMAGLAGAKPVVVACGMDNGYKLTAARLAAHLGERTRMLILNSPGNPSGAVYGEAELAALGGVLRRHPQVLVLSDDIYEPMQFAGRFRNLVNVCPDLKERTVVINGVSKTYAMTGWRIGYAAGPRALIAAMTNLQGQSTSNPTSVAQAAAEAALRGDQACVAEMARSFRERHDYVVAELNQAAGVRCLPSAGAFYAFANVEAAIGRLSEAGLLAEATDVAFADYLVEAGGLSLVPGTAFGLPGHIRISFATSMDLLRESMATLRRLCAAQQAARQPDPSVT